MVLDIDLERKKKTPITVILTLIFAGLLFGLIITRIFLEPYKVNDDSMAPELKKGDTVYILKHFSHKRGDIVLVNFPEGSDTYILRRIVAANGDTIEMINKEIVINGAIFSPSWKAKRDDGRVLPEALTKRDTMPKVTMSKEESFVMCDDLDNSFDSRSFGKIKDKQISGRILFTL